MSTHSEIEELIPLYVLGSLDDDESRKVEAHLSSCVSCMKSLNEFRPVADALAFSVPMQDLPLDLKAKTMERVIVPARPRISPAPVRPGGEGWRKQRLTFRWPWAFTLAGVAIVISLFAIGWSFWQGSMLRNQLTTQNDLLIVMAYAQGNAIDIKGTAEAPLAEGKLYAEMDSNVGALITLNLPRPQPGHVYQAWLWTTSKQWTSAGTFVPDDIGSAWLLVRAPDRIGSYALVCVTVEPTGGSSKPTSPLVLKAPIASQ